MSRPRVCILTDWFLPGYRAGGPIKSVANLVRSLGEWIDFRIITTNFDFGSTEPYPEVWPNTWMEWEADAQIYYFSKDRLTSDRVEAVIRQTKADFLHINSMFSIPFTVWPLKFIRTGKIKAQVLLSPRGMLHPGALSLKKTKKKAFLTAAKVSGIGKRVTFHATDAEEVKDIQREFGQRVRILMAPNLPDQTVTEWEETPKTTGLKLVFISRISRKKNLHFLLERLKGFEDFILLDLYGPVEAEAYQAELVRQIENLPGNIAVNFKGPIPQEKVAETLKDYHAFVLPTLGENFGHSIFEAFAAGKPVLISDQTPWRGLEAKKAGWDLPLDQPAAFEAAIQTLLDMDQKTYNTWCRSALRVASDFLASSDLIPQQLALYGLEMPAQT